MSDQPKTWHYGLIARWWAEFNPPGPTELAFYQSVVAQNEGPALDLACGTGRLLIPMLSAGLDVDGCDISPDMIAHCRDAAARQGRTPQLFQQAMHELDLPRSYGTIYICDSFGLGGNRKQDVEALRRCYEQLDPGGTLVFSHYLPYGDLARWPYWLVEERARLPEPWPAEGTRKQAGDGDEIELRVRVVALDPVEQRLAREIRADLWRNGRLVAQEERLLLENQYFRNELIVLLANAGFVNVSVRAGYSEKEATADDTMLVFVAHK